MLRFVLVALAFAALVYLLVRFLDKRHGRNASWGPAVRRQREQRRTVAPDDDDQFLRDLDKKRRDEPPSPS